MGGTCEHDPGLISKGNNRLGGIRLAVRVVALVAAVLAVVPIIPWSSAPLIVPALSPYVAIVSVIAVRSFGWATLVGLPVLLIVSVRRRWLCRWLCPVGLCAEYLGRLSPMSASRSRHVPPIGKWLVAFSVAGACVGYPLLVCLDPLAVFCGIFSLLREPLVEAGKVSAAALGVVVIVTVLLPGSWCLRMCPLGAMQELLIVPSRLLARLRNRPASSSEPDQPDAVRPARRSVLAMGVGALFGSVGVALGLGARRNSRDPECRVLRPPGAVDEWQFHQLCLRCGNCARACPVEIIDLDWYSERVAGWLTPVVSIRDDYCREDCDACMRVCPSGAIPLRSLAEKASALIGVVHIDMDRCTPALGGECQTACVPACPFDAIHIRKWTWQDDRRYPIIDSAKCPGCGACVLACSPMDALMILPRGFQANTRGSS